MAVAPAAVGSKRKEERSERSGERARERGRPAEGSWVGWIPTVRPDFNDSSAAES